MLRIEDYYTDAPSAGIITMLEKPEIVNRLLNTLICNFRGFNFMKLKLNVHPVREELEEYKNLNQVFLDQIFKLHAYYDGHQLALKRILRDINYDTHLNTKVFSPVVGCPVGCPYCFTKKVVEHFEITEDFGRQVFRGPYKITKDEEGYDVPELFNIENNDPIDWFLNYMSDYGCWRPEWQENLLQQIIAANALKRRKGKYLDTFQLITKRPKGIRLETVPDGTDLRNVIMSCTVDCNQYTDRITELIRKAGNHRITGCVIYQPVLEYIAPDHLEEFAETFGLENSWVIIGGEVGRNATPLRFEWIKDIVDKCIELGIPVKMEPDIRALVTASGYDFMEQAPEPVRVSKEIRSRNLAAKNAGASAYYEQKIAELKNKLADCSENDRYDIAAFTMFSDVELIIESARRLLAGAPDFDIILTAETKGIPLAYEMARQSGKSYLIVSPSARRNTADTIEVPVCPDDDEHKLYLEKEDFLSMKDRRVLIAGDIIGNGRALNVLAALVEKAGGIPVSKVAVLADEEASRRKDIVFLDTIPALSS
jgi:adenine/guanine phosphoribosyltransferase-like PRPP-binding protein/protein gp37